jgi:hypothetical protein
MPSNKGTTTMTTEKIKLFKNGAYVSFYRSPYGQWLIKAYSPSGAVLDRVVTFDYRTACEYRRAFNALAKAA